MERQSFRARAKRLLQDPRCPGGVVTDSTREAIFRAAIAAASLSFDGGISCAADMIREASRNEKFLAALRLDPAPALEQLAAAIASTNTPSSET